MATPNPKKTKPPDHGKPNNKNNDDKNDDKMAKIICDNRSATVQIAAPKRRRVSFRVGFTSEIFEIAPLTEYCRDHDKNGSGSCTCNYNNDSRNDTNDDASRQRRQQGCTHETILKEDLFYSDADYARFRASEQKRYEKMIAKKVQKMVHEKLQPEINKAVAAGATLEDIEAMVPKNHEEMVAYLGGRENLRGVLGGGAATFGGGRVHDKTKEKDPERDDDAAAASAVAWATPTRTIRSTRSSLVVRASSGSNDGGAASSLVASAAAAAAAAVVEPLD